MNRLSLSRVLLALTFLLPAASMADSNTFPVPDVIKNNVAFWIRIYTEISLKEGLLHDNEYPQIIYERITVGERSGRRQNEFVDPRRKIYADAIVAVRDSAPEKWGAAEKRVAELFKLAPEGAIAGAENRLRFQGGQRERFRLGLERSTIYLDTISAILKQHGVPDELKYLPHVESSFDAEAYSHAGAAGLWQFMRATGRLYMKIDYMFDERRDPIVSSVAAAKFLRSNYDMLQAWPLAITAYNHGPNGIRRAVEALGSRDIAVILQKHESASFRFASKNFYSCFVAVLQIVEKPEKYFKGLNYKPRFSATSIKLPFAAKPDALCKSLNITEQQFQRLNPGLRPVVFAQHKPLPAGYAVNLPDTIKGDVAIAALNSTPPAQRAVAQKEASEPYGDGYYTVARGDNLYGIAQRHGVAMRDLAEANNLTGSSRIYVGQVLTIPPGSGTAVAGKPAVAAKPAATSLDTIRIAAKKPSPPTPKTLPDTARVDTAKAVAAAKPSSKPSPDTASVDTAKAVAALTTPPPPEPPKLTGIRVSVTPPSFERIKPKPTAADTAKVAAVSIKKDTVKADTAKVAAVSIKKDTVKADTAKVTAAILTDTLSAAALTVAEPAPALSAADPSGKPSTDPRFDASVYDLAVRIAPDGQTARVRLLVDETAGHLAEWMRVKTDDIRRLNDLPPDAAFKLGSRVHIPIKPATNIQRFETARLQYHMAIEEDFFAQYGIVDFERRKARSGDNPWRISADAKIPMWLLNKYNSKIFYSLMPGNDLWIPRIAAKDGAHEAANPFAPAVMEPESE